MSKTLTVHIELLVTNDSLDEYSNKPKALTKDFNEFVKENFEEEGVDIISAWVNIVDNEKHTILSN